MTGKIKNDKCEVLQEAERVCKKEWSEGHHYLVWGVPLPFCFGPSWRLKEKKRRRCSLTTVSFLIRGQERGIARTVSWWLLFAHIMKTHLKASPPYSGSSCWHTLACQMCTGAVGENTQQRGNKSTHTHTTAKSAALKWRRGGTHIQYLVLLGVGVIFPNSGSPCCSLSE